MTTDPVRDQPERRSTRRTGTDPEEMEDALLEGDVEYERGTAQAAFRHREFRIVYLGTFASNIGTWMQNVLLGAYAYELTGSAGFVGLLFWAQLGPLLFLSPVGGVLADSSDRRRLLVSLQALQMALSFGLAALVLIDRPPQAALIALVLLIGVANALGAPGLSAILPTLVPREDIAGAVALGSIQMNLSRVIGPVIGAFVYSALGASPVFAINAATYAFAIAGLLVARYPRRVSAHADGEGLARLLAGFRYARADALVRHVMLTLYTFSFFSLPFVGLMAVLAAENLGIAPRSAQYGVLYATFGLGAALGATSVGTVLAARSKVAMLRPGFLAFAVLLCAFGLVRSAALAFPLALLVGYSYFVVITALSTVLQAHLADEMRGRVMALWIMGFGGTVPLGVVAGGWVAVHSSITLLIMLGAIWSVVLAVACDADVLRARGARD